MKVKFSKNFAKQLIRSPQKAQKAFERRLALFLSDPHNEILSNHALSGSWVGYRSINISGDLRAIFEIVDQDTAYFVAFGTHSQLYK